MINFAQPPSTHTNHNNRGAAANVNYNTYFDTFNDSPQKSESGFLTNKLAGESERFNSRTRKTPARQALVGITEINALHQDPYPSYLLAPFFSEQNIQSDKRWITCVTTKRISKQECESLGIDTRQLRIIRVAKSSDILWVSWEALATGNSRCVLSILESISSEESEQLRNAAILGNCHGLLLSTEKTCPRAISTSN